MFLGANIRPHDPRAEKYRLALRLDPSTADLSQERNLGNAWFGDTPGADYRVPITDQGQLGACTAFTVKENAEIAANLNGEDSPDLSAGWIYEMERRKEGSWPRDDGAYTTDGCDIVIAKGCPSEAVAGAYTARADTEYDSAAAEADAPKQKYVLEYYPIDVRSPDVLKLLWVALDNFLPLFVDTLWPENWFSPNRAGAVSTDYSDIAGGHSVGGYAMIPDASAPGGGYVAIPNHWSAQWNTQAQSYGHSVRKGDFLIPWATFLDRNTPIQYIGAVARVPIQPQPQPQPTDCRGQATAIADPIVAQYLADAKAHPRSLTRKAALAGAQAVRQALTAL
jgi:hypothetical protein